MLDSLLLTPLETPAGFRSRLRDRRRLRHIDRLGARLARLDAVDTLLGRTHDRLAAGWVQDAWFTTVDQEGVRLHVGTLRAHDGARSERACLVAALAIEAMPGTVTGPVAARAVGAMWSRLHGYASAQDLGVPPGVTAARAYDLVRWNDAPGRTQADVLAMVAMSRASSARSADRLRAELAAA